MQWCDNLEQCAHFGGRLDRGMTYLRNGSVVDLVIEAGKIRAVVAGRTPYSVEVAVAPLKPKVWRSIQLQCAEQIDSLLDLLQGNLAAGVMQSLTKGNENLLPKPSELEMTCSCPDYADVCKHIAATIYGVGSRLDQQPELLFTLRSVDHLELVKSAAQTTDLTQALGIDSGGFTDSELGSMFGIDIDSGGSMAIPQQTAAKPAGKPRRRSAPTTPTTTDQRAPEPEKSARLGDGAPQTSAASAARGKAGRARSTKVEIARPPKVQAVLVVGARGRGKRAKAAHSDTRRSGDNRAQGVVVKGISRTSKKSRTVPKKAGPAVVAIVKETPPKKTRTLRGAGSTVPRVPAKKRVASGNRSKLTK
jgi:uncharacterized Zn finger protein